MELNEAIDNINLLITNLENMSVKEIEPENYILLNSLNTVLEELDNRIPRKDIEDKLNEFVEKSLLDIAETEKFKFEYTLDGLYAIKYGVIHILNELLEDKE